MSASTSLPIYDIELLAQLVSDQTLELILMPTEACNFRCTYCYEDFTIGRMSADTITGVKALIARRAPELNSLYLSWFGGEPLVARDIVLDISAYTSTLSQSYPNLTYRAGATTNGYLLNRATVSQLAAVGVLDYQISLDGPRDIHDRSRRQANGRGSYDRIWENLLAIRDSRESVSVTLRVHFDADTVSQMGSLIDDLRCEFLSDARFSVFFKPIERLGGPNDAAIKKMSLVEEQVAIEMLKRKLYYDDLVEPKEEQPYVCYASRPNSLVIRANGSIGKCTVALDDTRNHVGSLRSDGTLEINAKRLTPWLRGLTTLDPEVLGCPLQRLPVEHSIKQ